MFCRRARGKIGRIVIDVQVGKFVANGNRGEKENIFTRLANVLPAMIAAKTGQDSNKINELHVTDDRSSDVGIFDET